MTRLKSHFTKTLCWRLFLIVVIALAVRHVSHEKLLTQAPIGKRGGSPRELGFKEFVHNGLWQGAAARGVLAVFLLGLSFVTSSKKSGGVRLELSGSPDADEPLAGRAFVVGLSVIMVAAAVMRLPRMTHSFWGDEADAVGVYVQGLY